MSLGRVSVVICGVVCVCTKSGGLVTRVSVVVVIVGTLGALAVVSVGTTLGGCVFLLLQAGMMAVAINRSPMRKPFTTLLMELIITFVLRGPRLAVRGPRDRSCEPRSAEREPRNHSVFFDQSGSLFSPSNVSCVRSVPSTRMR